MIVLEIVVLVLVGAILTRFIRLSESAAPLRSAVMDRSDLLAKLLACPHCLSFWLALAGTGLLWWVKGVSPADSLLKMGTFVILGWRGSYYVSRLMELRAARQRPVVDSHLRQCQACSQPYSDDFIDRHGMDFCSVACWFDYLKKRPRPHQTVTPSGDFIRQEMYPMSFKEIRPEEAKRLMDESNYAYVDVRSEPEFLNGHPSGAVNIPVMFRQAMGMVPNPDFVTVVEANFDRQSPILLGCQMGSRSGRAAEALVAAGFSDVSNVLGGFGGARDEQGQVVEKGWMELGLPVDYGEQEGRSYGELAGR